MMDKLRMDGYRQWLERSVRVDSDNDWGVHTIDYADFKRKLRYFNKRRTKLRRIMAKSDDGCSILASELDEIMGPPPQLLPSSNSNNNTNDDKEASSLLLPTPRAHGRTTSDLLYALTIGRSSSQNVNHHHHHHAPDPSSSSYPLGGVDYVAFPEEDESEKIREEEGQQQQGTSSRTSNNNMIPLQIETDAASIRPKRSSSASSSSSSAAGGLFWSGPPRVKRPAVMRQVSNFERNDMMIFLAMELDKVAMFYLSQWQVISQKILDYQTTICDLQQQQLGNASSRVAAPALQHIGTELLELEAFVVINLVTVRQILIRYDAFVRTLEGTPMSEYYMKFMMHNRFFNGAASSEDGALSRSFRKLMQHAELLALSESFVDICTAGQNEELIEKFKYQRMEFANVLESSERAQAGASSGHARSVEDTLLHTLRHYFLLGMMEDRLGYEPTYLISRGASLSKEMQIMADWRRGNTRKSSKDDLFSDEPEDDSLSKMSQQEMFNLSMALLAAFFYCMNYYIVEPSSTMYVNFLGGQDALSGALIGMMPMASFLAAIAYSIWTNHSFRHPFLVSCLLMLSGNIMYSYAYECKSLAMAFSGRFLTGLGGPKCIVRRYMADTTSLSIRTSVNAGFGMVVAAGSAFGPGCAILLNRLNFSIPLPGSHEIYVNGMTGPGYLMALLWFLFTVALSTGFEEPDRTGLEEQKRMELLQTKEETDTDMSGGSNYSRGPPKRTQSTDNDSVGSTTSQGNNNDDLMTIYSGATTSSYDTFKSQRADFDDMTWREHAQRFSNLVTFPVRICLCFLFAKVFVIETLVSSTSTLSKNRYRWQVHEVGILGCVNGLFVIPLSVLVGRLSMSYQDRFLMMWLLGIGLAGLLILIDITDLFSHASTQYNEDNFMAVGPKRYVLGYVIVYMSIQSFEGVNGSALSKLIPTALASGTLNSGLLATLVDTFGRTCGDLFICMCGFINLRELMDLLFIPGAIILATCLLVVRKYYDLLAV